MSTPPPPPPDNPWSPPPSSRQPWSPPSPAPVWGQPAGYRPQPALNGFALASLLSGLLCFPPLGIAFGIAALVQIAKRGDRGKALAIVGLVVSLVLTVSVTLAVSQYGQRFFDRLDTMRQFEHTEGEFTDIDEMRAGDCFNVPGGDLLDESRFVYKVGCAEVHDGEVTSSALLDDGAFPGGEQMEENATRTCWKAMDEYAMDAWVLPSYADMFHFSPSRDSWREGDRRLLCVIGTAEKEHRGSLRNDAGMLTPEQVTFLRAMNAADHAMLNSPDEEVDETLPEYRAWARKVDEALGAEAKVLEGVKDRPDVGVAARAQLKEVEAARKAWREASRATNPERFDAAWERAADALSVDTEKALRGAYKLSTTVPEWLEDSSGGSGDSGGSGNSGGSGGSDGGSDGSSSEQA
ncbi:DUF4190 domain-containing protein [Streptomyces sp. ISL-86]|uniref:DUF4190 domain-containing protein n=1 Tax=Streptomyces sp. ISL-86 TaxID=2819187 RepID=UPI001BE83CF6|nr:DUF4190 domain-containing protein [Streptomyces sp. ISL-86]MBT2456553.1 DUF4190 domain-containing protein [Streptomyces sp. ISL-86]